MEPALGFGKCGPFGGCGVLKCAVEGFKAFEGFDAFDTVVPVMAASIDALARSLVSFTPPLVSPGPTDALLNFPSRSLDCGSCCCFCNWSCGLFWEGG